jgi:hypothetical protein
MDAPDRKHWVRAALVVGVTYAAIGIAFSVFGSWSASSSGHLTWNRLAFLASGIVFAFHIAYEHFRLHSSVRPTAARVSIAVAIGAFLLALKANIHDLGSATGYRPRVLIALVAWPLLTAVPAFIVALVVASGLTFKRRNK